jgi:hypothetical protein
MKAVIVVPGSKLPCVVYWTGRKGLSAVSTTWCKKQGNAADGVIQVPDETKVCEACELAIKLASK